MFCFSEETKHTETPASFKRGGTSVSTKLDATQDNFNTGLSVAGGQNPIDDSLSNKDDSMTMIGFGSSSNGFMPDKIPETHKNEVTTGFDEGASSQSSFKEHHYMHTNQDHSVSD